MASRLPVTLGVAGAILLLDQVTKAIAVATLEGKPAVEVVGRLLTLYLVRNPGAAFSLAGGYTVLISCLAIGVAFFIVRSARTLTSVWWAVVLGGILGGALGNLMDRMLRAPAPFRGHVVDFLQLPNWPVFNVADMALVGSAILAVVLSIVGVEMSEPPVQPGDADLDQGPAEPGESQPQPAQTGAEPAQTVAERAQTVAEPAERGEARPDA